jgi:hypothetical protein
MIIAGFCETKPIQRHASAKRSLSMVVVIVAMTTPASLTLASFFSSAKKNDPDFARGRFVAKSHLRQRQIRSAWRNAQLSPWFSGEVLGDFNVG